MNLNTPSTQAYFEKLKNLQNEDYKTENSSLKMKSKRDSTEQKGSIDSFQANIAPHVMSVPSEITSRKSNFQSGLNPSDQELLDNYIANVGAVNFDLTSGVEVFKEYLTEEKIPVTVYQKKNSRNPKNRPAIMNIHGGGFVAGSVDQADNACRYLAEQNDMMVFNVDYRLAPQYSYKEATADCYNAMRAIYENEDFSFDHNRFFVFGDSAGGNLSAVTAYQDSIADKYLSGAILFYPVVELGTKNPRVVKWPIEDYHASADAMPTLEKITAPNRLSEVMMTVYGKGADLEQPLISPYNISDDDFPKLPPMLVVTCGFDSLRPQGEAFAKKLAHFNVPTSYICYTSVEHAFLDKLGIYPQAQDSIHEIIDWINQIN